MWSLIGWLLFQTQAAVGQQFSHIYAFGDSYTDYGNLFGMTGRTQPDPRYYYEGRTSNGPTWIEVTSDLLPGKPNVTSFAFGGSTSDNVKFPAPVPGAKQQVDSLFEEYRNKSMDHFNQVRNDSLVVYSFGGNDLFQPNVDVKAVMTELVGSLSRLIDRTRIPRVMVTVSNGIKFTPFTNAIPEPQRSGIIALAEDMKLEWAKRMVELRLSFPSTTFYEFHGQSFWQNTTFGRIPYTNRLWNNKLPCLIPTSDIDPPSPCPAKDYFQPTFTPGCSSVTNQLKSATNFDVCPDPDVHVFWDDIHPTAAMHRQIAQHMVQVLSGTSFS